jgi:glycosyltransferase involved in cell wall biosynthesis
VKGDRLEKRVQICMHLVAVGRTNIRLMRSATALVEAGYRVTIVDLERDTSRPPEEDVEGIHFKHVVMPSRFVKSRFKPWFLVKMAAAVLRGMALVARTPADVYHANDDASLPGCYIAAVLRRKKLIYDAYELPLVQRTLTRYQTLCRLARGTLRLLMPRCSGVITVSPPIVDYIQQRYGGPRAVLVRNIPPYTPPLLGSNRLRERLACSPQTHIALYQGGLQENRRLDILVRAARYLHNDQMIVLMGSGVSQPGLEALIQQEGVGERIQILPPVPYDELLPWTASADVGLVVFDPGYSLSIQYCLPNKLFEYLMAGVPILASPLDAVSELLAHYDVGVTTASIEPEAVGRSLAALLADTGGQERMRQNALTAARTEFRWDVESQRLVALYQEVVGKPAAEPESVPRLRVVTAPAHGGEQA